MGQKEEMNTGKKVEQIWTDLAKGEGDEHVGWGALHFHWKQRSHEKQNTLQFIIYNQHQHQCIKKYNQCKIKCFLSLKKITTFGKCSISRVGFKAAKSFPQKLRAGRERERVN